MTLERPDLVGPAILVAIALAAALALQWRRLRRLGSAFDRHAAMRLLPAGLESFPAARLACLVLGGLALGVAAAGPAPTRPEPAPPPIPLDLAIAVDVSRSMGADDAAPTRLERVKAVVEELADALPGARTSLVVFADWAYTLLPPADDPALLRFFARSLASDVVLDRDQGTSLARAIEEAHEALGSRGRPGARRVILVLSDGDAHDGEAAATEAAARAREDGIEVWAGGVGTERGAALGTAAEPVLDAAGGSVVARLDESLLRAVATAGGGSYEDAGSDGTAAVLASRLGGPGGERASGGPSPESPAGWLTLLAIPLLLWEGAMDAGRARPVRRRRAA